MKISKTIKEHTWWNITNINYNVNFNKNLRFSVPTRSELQKRQTVHISFAIHKGNVEQNIYVGSTIHLIKHEN
jgi:hypothetical protein